jgi:cytochrome c oxidase subunit 2
MKEDVVPGRITKQWFNVSKAGVFDVECAEYCGTRHSYMLTKIHVMEPEAYKKWFESKSRRPGEPEKQMSRGEQLFAENGCSGCHALESDKVIVGPSLKGIALKHDFQYLKDAIIHPNKDVPEGFTAGVMPAFKMSDEDVKALIDYISGAEKGKVVFEENGCAGCHATDSDKVLVGPSLKDIGKKHDVAYLKDAITNPDKDVAKGFSPGVMPPFKLPEDQLNNLIAYLKTL